MPGGATVVVAAVGGGCAVEVVVRGGSDVVVGSAPVAAEDVVPAGVESLQAAVANASATTSMAIDLIIGPS